MKPALKAKMVTARGELLKLLTVAEDERSTLAELAAQRDKLAGELETLKASTTDDPSDYESVAKLDPIRKQLDLMHLKHARLAASADFSLPKRLRESIALVAPILNDVMAVEKNKLVREGTNAFSPFYTHQDRAERAVLQSDALTTLAAFAANATSCAGGIDPLLRARSLVTLLDSMLAGKTVWSWPR